MIKDIKTIINKTFEMILGRFIPKINIGMMIRTEEARQTQFRAGEGK